MDAVAVLPFNKDMPPPPGAVEPRIARKQPAMARQYNQCTRQTAINVPRRVDARAVGYTSAAATSPPSACASLIEHAFAAYDLHSCLVVLAPFW